MNGNFAKLLITIAALKKENDRLTNIINEKGDLNENQKYQTRNSRQNPNNGNQAQKY